MGKPSTSAAVSVSKAWGQPLTSSRLPRRAQVVWGEHSGLRLHSHGLSGLIRVVNYQMVVLALVVEGKNLSCTLQGVWLALGRLWASWLAQDGNETLPSSFPRSQ